MARVTVEDCVIQVPNRFELVLVGAQRAREIASGAQLMLDRDRDKNPVVALREIAEEKLNLDGLKESLVRGLQRRIEPEQPEEEVVKLMASEQQDWIGVGKGGDDFSEDFEDDSAEDGEGGGDMAMDDGGSFEDADIDDR